MFQGAAESGDIQKMKWLQDNGFFGNFNTIGLAKQNPNRSIVQATVELSPIKNSV